MNKQQINQMQMNLHESKRNVVLAQIALDTFRHIKSRWPSAPLVGAEPVPNSDFVVVYFGWPDHVEIPEPEIKRVRIHRMRNNMMPNPYDDYMLCWNIWPMSILNTPQWRPPTHPDDFVFGDFESTQCLEIDLPDHDDGVDLTPLPGLVDECIDYTRKYVELWEQKMLAGTWVHYGRPADDG